jgi:hypothetical protein
MQSALKYGLVLALFCCGCTFSTESHNEYLPDPGFNLAHSDPAAVELADSIMAALGGRKSWIDVRYLSWEYDTLRTIAWDKRDGNVRIESRSDSTIYLFNVDTGKGRVAVGGREVTEPGALRDRLREAASLWIHDSFWIRIIYQLKGDGITLHYLGEARTDSARYNLLRVSLEPDTEAPVEEFLAYVDLRDNRIRLCTDLRNSPRELASYGPGYQQQGDLMVPSRAGAAHNIRVHRNSPDKLFNAF